MYPMMMSPYSCDFLVMLLSTHKFSKWIYKSLTYFSISYMHIAIAVFN